MVQRKNLFQKYFTCGIVARRLWHVTRACRQNAGQKWRNPGRISHKNLGCVFEIGVAVHTIPGPAKEPRFGNRQGRLGRNTREIRKEQMDRPAAVGRGRFKPLAIAIASAIAALRHDQCANESLGAGSLNVRCVPRWHSRGCWRGNRTSPNPTRTFFRGHGQNYFNLTFWRLSTKTPDEDPRCHHRCAGT